MPGLAWLNRRRCARYNRPVKLDIAEDDIPLVIRALEHYAAYLEATKRPDDRYVALAEELKRKQSQWPPAGEVS